MSEEEDAEAAVRRWLESVVIGLELCPFARREFDASRIRFAVSPARSEPELLQALEVECNLLLADESTATTLLIHPQVLADFGDYNQFLDLADGLLQQLQLTGVFQVASFHPRYRFAGTGDSDAENFTNRSPYPILHILRERSVSEALESMPDAGQIPERNIATMNELGTARLQQLLHECMGPDIP